MTKLIALAVIAAGAIALDSAEIPADTVFDVPQADADPLVAQGLAKLAEEPTQDTLQDSPKPPGKTISARVLLACAYGQPDEVVTLPVDVAKQAEKAGQVDTNKAAVAYAKTLGA